MVAIDDEERAAARIRRGHHGHAIAQPHRFGGEQCRIELAHRTCEVLRMLPQLRIRPAREERPGAIDGEFVGILEPQLRTQRGVFAADLRAIVNRLTTCREQQQKD
jgi:hypothetical protein